LVFAIGKAEHVCYKSLSFLSFQLWNKHVHHTEFSGFRPPTKMAAIKLSIDVNGDWTQCNIFYFTDVSSTCTSYRAL